MSEQGQIWDAGRVVIKGRRGRKVTCTCGTCPKCQRRDYIRDYYYGIRRGRPAPSETRGGPNKDGYMVVYLRRDDPLFEMATRGDRGVMEHRLVMARHLGRPLATDELVHHRNGDKTDNRIENLELGTRSHPNGQRVEDMLEWARAFVTRYNDFYPTGTP